MKRHDTSVLGPLRTLPGNTFVGMLLSDDRIPLFFFTGNLRLPVQMCAVELLNLHHAFHEFGKFLELRPLVVGRSDGDLYFN